MKGSDRHNAGVPGLSEQLRVLTADEDHALRVSEGERQPFKSRFVEDENTRGRRVRMIHRFDLPRTAVT